MAMAKEETKVRRSSYFSSSRTRRQIGFGEGLLFFDSGSGGICDDAVSSQSFAGVEDEKELL